MSDVPEHVDWDLSDSHLPADVGWEPRSEMDLAIWEGVESVHIELPAGQVFEATSNIHDVTLGNEGESLTLIAVEFQPQSLDDAYKRALGFAEDWGMRVENIHQWYRQASQRGNDLPPIGRTHTGDFLGGRDGPQPTVELRPYTQERPALVSFQLHWV